MGKLKSGAEQFIGNLEGLLQAARQAAAATLLREQAEVRSVVGREDAPTPAGGGPEGTRWTLHRCSPERSDGGLGVVVQFLAGQRLYEGRVVATDGTESPVRVGARAALAALDEWAREHSGQWRFGLGDVVEISTEQGAGVVAVVGVRRSDGENPGQRERWLVGAALSEGDDAWAGAR